MRSAKRRRLAAAEVFSRRKRRQGGATPTAELARLSPALRKALQSAKERFSRIPGVEGVGVGMPYSESRSAYRRTRAKNKLCLKILVKAKVKKKALPPGHRIPHWIVIPARGSRRGVRVVCDVVTSGGHRSRRRGRERPRGGFQEGHGWPTAGAIRPGRLFVFAHSETPLPSVLHKDISKIGTMGAVIRLKSNQGIYGVTAGHTFTQPCQNDFSIPRGNLGMGARSQEWTRMERDNFFPPSIDTGPFIRDVVLFNMPAFWDPGAGRLLPSKFLGELATPQDRQSALEATDENGLVVVERRTAQGTFELHEIPVDLAEGFPDLLAEACGAGNGKLPFGLTWRLRFTRSIAQPSDNSVTTIPGDSGAPVYIRAADQPGSYRLLGFHFLELENTQHGGSSSYAMDSASFFREVLGVSPSEWRLL